MANRASGDKAVMILATTFVLVGGAGASLFLIVTSSGNPLVNAGYFAGGCAVVAFLWWILRDPDPLAPKSKGFWFRRKQPKNVHYQIAVRKPPVEVIPPGPPTVEQIRELNQDNLRTWVPSRNSGKAPPRQ